MSCLQYGSQLLIVAIKTNSVDDVKSTLENNVRVNEADKVGCVERSASAVWM